MSRLPRVLLFTASVALATALPARADEITDKQRKVAEENLKKGDIATATAAETNNLFVFATIPADKTKAFAAALQKVYTTALKPLGYDDKDTPWKGKLAIYAITDRKQYDLFVRFVAGEKPDGTTHTALRGDEPYVVFAVEPGKKGLGAELLAEGGQVVAVAMMASRAGTGAVLPEWVKGGFGRAVAVRSAGPSSTRLAAYRTQAKRVVLGGGQPIASIWDGSAKFPDVMAMSLMDYLAFGPKAADFSRVVAGFRPGDNGTAPNPQQALEAAGWKIAELEYAWKKWVQTGK